MIDSEKEEIQKVRSEMKALKEELHGVKNEALAEAISKWWDDTPDFRPISESTL